MFINANNWPKFFTLLDAPEGVGYPYLHAGYPFLMDQDNYSAAKPPWGELLCLDLATGDYRWRRPIGEYAELKAKGIDGDGHIQHRRVDRHQGRTALPRGHARRKIPRL